MPRLGSKERPAVVRVKTMEKAAEIVALCDKHGWEVIAGIEPDKPEDISDLKKLLNPPRRVVIPKTKIGRNDPCPCGSGKKYKKCCGRIADDKVQRLDSGPER
ncbi:MAG: PBPRA1643 family SWIM/SEC-C metal-binding motif protein [Candidatus Bathycorpusculaceae bacterium]